MFPHSLVGLSELESVFGLVFAVVEEVLFGEFAGGVFVGVGGAVD